MAEFVMRDMVEKAGVAESFEIASAATSTEEIGNDVYPPVKRLLHAEGIRCSGHGAHQITRGEYEHYDYVVIMDEYNRRNLERLLGPDTQKKVSRLRDFTSNPGDIADPWYTRDFELTYRQVIEGCQALLNLTLR